jgi:hypothetical protein
MIQKVLLGVIAVAAVAGWVVAFLGMNETSDLEERLAAAKIELTKASKQLTDTQSQLALQQSAVGNLDDVDKRLVEKQTEAAALAEEIEAKRRESETLKQDLDSGKTELGALADRISASKSELSRLAQDQEAAEAELGRLQAESEARRGAATVSPAETQTAVQAPGAPDAPPAAPPAAALAPPAAKATAAAATTPAADPLTEAKRRFARIDQDGDSRFDRLDFRLKRVSLFGKVDANEDGYLTFDETLLSPEAFKQFDTDGDGKISSAETADRQSFSVMDANRDNFVTFEEYVKILRIGPD